MGGSAKGKQAKAKRSSKSKKSDKASRHPATSTSDLDGSQRKQETPSEFEKTKNDNLDTGTSLSMDMSECEKVIERSMNILLYNKLEMLYAEAFQYLVAKNIKSDEARNAILMNGHALGKKSLFKNIVDNAEKFLNSGKVTDEESPNGCMDFNARVESLMRMMMRTKEQLCEHSSEIDAIRQLVGLCGTPRINRPVPQEDIAGASSKNLVSPKELEAGPTSAVPHHIILSSEYVDWEDPDLLSLLEKEPDDVKDVLILSALKKCRDLSTQVKESKYWAVEKVDQVEKKFFSHLLEIEKLRSENLENQQLKKSITRLREMDAALWNATYQIEQATKNVRYHELLNSEVRETIESYTVKTLKSNRDLREVEKRERKLLNKVAASEEENNMLRVQVEEEKQKMLQLEEELLQLSATEEEAKEKLAKEVKEKESAIALVAEEERRKNIAEAEMRTKRELLHQKAETTRKNLEDEMSRLLDELAVLQANEVGPSEEYMLNESPEELSGRECIKCSRNDASVLFMPCAHQVMCSKCNDEEMALARCPCCQVQIDEKIPIYGAN